VPVKGLSVAGTLENAVLPVFRYSKLTDVSAPFGVTVAAKVAVRALTLGGAVVVADGAARDAVVKGTNRP
jgi:hypothetical protein